PGEREPAARVPTLTAQLTGFAFQDGQVQIGRFEAQGSGSVRDPRPGRRARYQLSTVRASIADLTWPEPASGRLDVLTAIPGGGTLAVSGMVRPPPAASQLRLRVTNLQLAPWTQFLPVPALIQRPRDTPLPTPQPL